MTTAPTAFPADDPDALAARAVAPDCTPEERDDALRHLRPFIERQVRRVCVRFSGQTRNDLIDDAVAIVWEALAKYDPERPFEPWCRTVLRNHTIDSLRRTARLMTFAPAQAARAVSDPTCRRALEAALERGESLPSGDVEAMDGWPPRDRVVLGCLSGLWRKAPPGRWERWLEECREENGFPPEGGFPPDGFEDLGAPDRTAALADLLGQRLNTLRVWIHRGRGRLWQLSYVRDRISLTEDSL
jgi:RNA polymerase sigma factor (sigma-70 family)